MTDIALQVDGLSKTYQIGHKPEPYKTLRDALSRMATAPVAAFRTRKHPAGSKNSTFWALKDVSFELRRGEVLGVIGRNGAGKTTLLKILSRITEPTGGYAEVRGRLASLLEVGTGFHPELTGRENIFLNGSILGMRKSEITRKFDEIVDFAEVGKFIDTPVKHYSSGMFVRLAFAVAAHLEPEILVLDEVLAVGDANFQRKCLGKMGDVAKEGRTVLFVSHNLSQIRNLCEKGLWLDKGKYVQYGAVNEVAAAYQRSLVNPNSAPPPEEWGQRQTGCLSWRLADPSAKNRPHMLLTDEPFSMELVVYLNKPVSHSKTFLTLQSEDGRKLGTWVKRGISLREGFYRMQFSFPSLPVRPGVYFWEVNIWDAATKIDSTLLHPELVVATQDLTLLGDESAGILNVPVDFHVEQIAGAEATSPQPLELEGSVSSLSNSGADS